MPVTTVSFLGFTLLVAVISYLYTRRDRMTTWDAYFLGGRSLTAWVIAGSLMLTNLSTEHLIGLNGDAFNHTIAVTAWETTRGDRDGCNRALLPAALLAYEPVDDSGIPCRTVRQDLRRDRCSSVSVLLMY